LRMRPTTTPSRACCRSTLTSGWPVSAGSTASRSMPRVSSRSRDCSSCAFCWRYAASSVSRSAFGPRLAPQPAVVQSSSAASAARCRKLRIIVSSTPRRWYRSVLALAGSRTVDAHVHRAEPAILLLPDGEGVVRVVADALEVDGRAETEHVDLPLRDAVGDHARHAAVGGERLDDELAPGRVAAVDPLFVLAGLPRLD